MSERQGEKVGVGWSWPEEQCLSYKITPLPNALMSVSAIGKQLVALSKLLESSEDGLRWKAILRAIYTEADGSIRFDIGIAPKVSAIKASAPTPADGGHAA